MFVTLALLGLRRSELPGVRWEDVDLEAGLFQVKRGLHRMDGGLQVIPTKTVRSRRTIPLPPVVRDQLCTQWETQEAERKSLGSRCPESGFVFTASVGTPVDLRNCTRMIQEACQKAGVRVVRMHDFRHGYVSVLLGLGVRRAP